MNLRSIPIDWHIPDDLRAEFATNIVVQKGEHEIFLLFFQAQPPILIGEEEEVERKLSELPAVKAKCVAKVILAPERLADLVRLLTTTLENYKSSLPGEKE
jgi:hypothetical protein